LRFTAKAQLREPAFILDCYHVQFTAGPTARNVRDVAPQKYDGAPTRTLSAAEGSLLLEGSAHPKVQISGKMATHKEGWWQSISYVYRERAKQTDPFFSLWEFQITHETIPKGDIITVTPDACLLPRSTFHVPDGDNHHISIMISSHYTMVNRRLQWLPRPSRNGTIGWRNFYHEMLVDMPIVDWPGGDPDLHTLYLKMLPSTLKAQGESFTGSLFSGNLDITCFRYIHT